MKTHAQWCTRAVLVLCLIAVQQATAGPLQQRQPAPRTTTTQQKVSSTVEELNKLPCERIRYVDTYHDRTLQLAAAAHLAAALLQPLSSQAIANELHACMHHSTVQKVVIKYALSLSEAGLCRVCLLQVCDRCALLAKPACPAGTNNTPTSLSRSLPAFPQT
jgi:hypothetical protein